jgi:hypothetical protein
MAIYDSNSLILKLKLLTRLIQNLNRVNQNHSYTNLYNLVINAIYNEIILFIVCSPFNKLTFKIYILL